MSLTDVEEFPMVPRTVLVRLRSVPETDCTGLGDAIQSVSTKSPFSSFNLPSRLPSSSPTPCPHPCQPSPSTSTILTPQRRPTSAQSLSPDPSLLPWGSTAWVTPRTTRKEDADGASSDTLPSTTSLFDPSSHHCQGKDGLESEDEEEAHASRSSDSWSNKPKVSDFFQCFTFRRPIF